MSRTHTLKTHVRPAYASIQNRDIVTKLNKNAFPKYSREVPRDGLGEVELIHIQNKCDFKKIIQVTNNLVDLFRDCLILLRKGCITIFKNKTDFQKEIEDIPKHVPYEQIKDCLNSSGNFVVYHNLDGITCALSESSCSYTYVMTKLENIEKRKSGVTIPFENIYNKHRERNVKARISQESHSKETTALNVCEINISLSRSKESNQLDHKIVVLPRENYQPAVVPLSEPVSPSRIFCMYPILENANYSWNLPTQHTDENSPSPTLNTTGNPEYVPAVTAHVPTQISAEVQVQYASYRSYTDRLDTYSGSGKTKPERKYLSQAGFFYTGTNDLVRCFCCGIGLTDLNDDITPITEHVRHSDQCSFLPELIGEENLSRLKKELRAKDPEYNRRVQLRELHEKNRHPDYETIEARLSSYSKWPLGLSPQLLAETGLYYTGFETFVCCFACDGGFRKIRATDDLWLDHCFYFPSCPFMRRKLGKGFIDLVQRTVCDILDEEEKENGVIGESNSQKRTKNITPQNRRYLREECLEMGFQAADIDDALQELIARGYSHNIGPVLDILEKNRLKKESPLREKLESKLPDYHREENEKMRKMVDCNICKKKANALFLPCKHHTHCMNCAVHYKICPICKTDIKEKVKTYMG